MKRLGLILCCIWATSCGKAETPTSPSLSRLPEEGRITLGTTQFSPSSLDGLQGKIDWWGNGASSAWVRNVGTRAVDVFLATYKCESPGCSVQSLFDFQVVTLGPDDRTRLRVREPGCFQVDLGAGNESVVRAGMGVPGGWYSTVDGFVVIGDCGWNQCPTWAPYKWGGLCNREPKPPEDPKPPVCQEGYYWDSETQRCEGGPPECDSCECNPNLCPPPEGDLFCGDGIVTTPETCDPPGTDTCDLQCQTIVPPPPPVDHGACYYEVSGRNKEVTCLNAGGVYSTHDGSDHCVFVFPGISRNGFNLAPGFSDPDCLRKQDN